MSSSYSTDILLSLYIYVFAIAGQTAEPNWLSVLWGNPWVSRGWHKPKNNLEILEIPRATPDTSDKIMIWYQTWVNGLSNLNKSGLTLKIFIINNIQRLSALFHNSTKSVSKLSVNGVQTNSFKIISFQLNSVETEVFRFKKHGERLELLLPILLWTHLFLE